MLKNQRLIPQEWKGKCVYFVGSINVDEDGEPYVRNLSWNGDTWLEDRDYLWLKKTPEHPLTPTIDDLRLSSWDVVAVLAMEHIVRPKQ